MPLPYSFGPPCGDPPKYNLIYVDLLLFLFIILTLFIYCLSHYAFDQPNLYQPGRTARRRRRRQRRRGTRVTCDSQTGQEIFRTILATRHQIAMGRKGTPNPKTTILACWGGAAARPDVRNLPRPDHFPRRVSGPPIMGDLRNLPRPDRFPRRVSGPTIMGATMPPPVSGPFLPPPPVPPSPPLLPLTRFLTPPPLLCPLIVSCWNLLACPPFLSRPPRSPQAPLALPSHDHSPRGAQTSGNCRLGRFEALDSLVALNDEDDPASAAVAIEGAPAGPRSLDTVRGKTPRARQHRWEEEMDRIEELEEAPEPGSRGRRCGAAGGWAQGPESGDGWRGASRGAKRQEQQPRSILKNLRFSLLQGPVGDSRELLWEGPGYKAGRVGGCWEVLRFRRSKRFQFTLPKCESLSRSIRFPKCLRKMFCCTESMTLE